MKLNMKIFDSMNNEYIAPKMEITTILYASTILTVSNPVLEDFDVSDGEW